MHLVSPLAAGVRGAENGTAEVYIRGTNTLVAFFTDFEATTTDADGIAALDSNGRALVYVDRLVRVVVKDSTGATVVTFVAGAAAEAVEVTNPAFTGNAYSGGASAAGNPTTLDAVLSKWLTSAGAGAIDFGVLYSGARVSLQTLAGLVAAEVFNVKNPTYGAKGDGSTDDTTAINAAKTAAAAVGGGIVFFPPGTYRITTALTVQSGISLLGSGIGVSTISVDHATRECLTISASTNRRVVSGFTLQSSQSNSGAIVDVAAGGHLSIYQCKIGGANNTGIGVDSRNAPAGFTIIEQCILSSSGVASQVYGYDLVLRDCKVVAPNTAFTEQVKIVNRGRIENCDFDMSAVAAGTVMCVNVHETAAYAYILGCEFTAGAGAVVTAIDQSITGGVYSNTLIAENNNTYGASVGLNVGQTHSADTTAGNRRWLGSRIGRTRTLDDNSATLDITAYAQFYDTIIVRRSTATNQTITLTYTNMVGLSDLTIIVHNISGTGNIATETVLNGTAAAVNDTVKKVWRFKYDVSPHTAQTYKTCVADGLVAG